jgi:DNA replication protein DnaC
MSISPTTAAPPQAHAEAADPLHTGIDEACRSLHLPTIRAAHRAHAHDALREQATYTQFLAGLLAAERAHRDQQRRQRLVREAAFPRPKRLEDFDFTASPTVTAAVVHTLTDPAWVHAGHPLCLLGDSGTGKSHLLIGLGTALAEAGLKVRYTTAANLVNELAEAADERRLSKVVARYGRVDLLCLDELGYLELDATGAKLLFQVLTEREERRSVAVASNAPFSEWGRTFTDPRLCKAVVDRLTFNAHIIETGTESYRLRTTLRRATTTG